MAETTGHRTAEGRFLFGFDAWEDRRKAFPYACRFYLTADSDLEREFFDLDRDWVGKNDVRVSGEYEAEAGDVIEECTHSSWKNKYREHYLVSPAGEKVDMLGDKAEIRKYLRGKLSAEDIVHADDREKFAGGRRRELEAERERLRSELEKVEAALAEEAAPAGDAPVEGATAADEAGQERR